MLKDQFPEIIEQQPLSRYSNFQTGGPADYFYKLSKLDELPKLINAAQKQNIHVELIGAGSNLIFHDEGFRGLIIRLEANKITHQEDELTAEAGATIAQILNYTVQNQLTGLESWTGLPGTIGGAVRGNAGCRGLETKDLLLNALLFDPHTSQTHREPKQYFNFDYRTSHLKETGEIVLSATLKLQKLQDSPQSQKDLINEARKWRITHQPRGLTTGSFFKNPNPTQPAGLLIDQSGLKGKTLGKAQISPQHANFFINTGGATTTEILDLARLARQEVKAKFNITLKPEVQIYDQYGKTSL